MWCRFAGDDSLADGICKKITGGFRRGTPLVLFRKGESTGDRPEHGTDGAVAQVQDGEG
jgi:hypothetical protein